MAKIWANSKRKKDDAKLLRIAIDLQSAVTLPSVSTADDIFVNEDNQLTKREAAIRGTEALGVESWAACLKLLIVVVLGLSTKETVIGVTVFSLILVFVECFWRSGRPSLRSEKNEGCAVETMEEYVEDKRKRSNVKVMKKKIMRALAKKFRGKKSVQIKEGFVNSPLMKLEEVIPHNSEGSLEIHVDDRKKYSFACLFAIVLAGLVGGRTFSFILIVGLFAVPVLFSRLKTLFSYLNTV